MSTPSRRRPGRSSGLSAKLTDRVAELRTAHPDAEVQLWPTDEHRIGLLPLIRKVWAPTGMRPVAQVQQRYEWLYVCGLVHPRTGETEWWLLPIVTAALVDQMLAAFARDVGAGPEKQILLVLDGAGWLTGEEAQVPVGIQLVFLPSYSPELQAAEHLWPLTNEPLANRRFESVRALEAVQAERCLVLQQQPGLIRHHTVFHWWPTDA